MSSNQKRVAVTGASGMVGARVVAELLECGYNDIVLPMRNAARGEKMLATLSSQGYKNASQRVRIEETGLNNPIFLAKALAGCNTVFHCAAAVSFDDDNAPELIQENVELTSHVVNAALRAGVERFVHVSSIAALGEAPPSEKFIDETCNLESMASTSAYGISKFMCENQVKRGEIEGLHTIIVNPAVILGEGDWDAGGSASIIPMLSKGLPVYTSGVVGYVDVRDVARAMVTLSECSTQPGERYILASANLSMRELITLSARAAGRPAPFIGVGKVMLSIAQRIENRVAQLTGQKSRLSQSMTRTILRKSYYNGEKIKKVCNFEYTPIEHTVARIVKAYINRKNG